MKLPQKLHVKNALRQLLSYLHVHNNTYKKNIIIFSTPRSGSTLLMDLIALNPRVKVINEPLNKGRANELSKFIENVRWRYFTLTPNEEKGLKNYFNYLIETRISTNQKSIIKHSWYTDRYVIKCLRAPGLVEWFLDNLDFQAFYLIRHPIPSSLSRIRNGWTASRKKENYAGV